MHAIAIERDEAVLGESSIAAPIFDRAGMPWGRSRWSATLSASCRGVRLAASRAAVVESARGVSRVLGAASGRLSRSAEARFSPPGSTLPRPRGLTAFATSVDSRTLFDIVEQGREQRLEDRLVLYSEAATSHFGDFRDRGPGARGPGSVVATLKLAGKVAPFTGADLLGISFAFGLIIAALVYAIGKVSAATSTRP